MRELTILASVFSFLATYSRITFAFAVPTRRRAATSIIAKVMDREGPVWDPVQQIYVGGVVPENAAVTEMIAEAGGCLRLFGYGSLCWNPGTDTALAHESVTSSLGRAIGYRRCWAQKSTDHRGMPEFPGIVCTLLKDEEFREFRRPLLEEASLTEGLVYLVPPELVEECLAELDFREKGGYARDIIEVKDDETGKTVHALLYRGTPDNPAFWPRALKDLPFAAATMAVAVGPSGENEVYLRRLDQFLESTACPSALEKFDDTFALASMTKTLMTDYQLFFLFGGGSNQHNQLLLDREENAADLVNGEDAHELKEIVACVHPANGTPDSAVNLFAGGGHSAILTQSGRLYLFGWNENGQLGTSGSAGDAKVQLPVLAELQNVRIKDAALGFSHTLVIEKDTDRLLCFGDNARGQVDAVGKESKISEPVTPSIAQGKRFASVATGLFHSSGVTDDGQLITFGCNRFGQTLAVPWQPDNARITRVACGRRHTIAVDDQSRIWSFGDNKYGQLGRDGDVKTPGLVLDMGDMTVEDIACGWSHTIVLVRDNQGATKCYGWGRNDRGQLGLGHTNDVPTPVALFGAHDVQSISCGSESTVIVDEEDDIWCCGWNEHGNLCVGSTVDALELVKASGTRVVKAPSYPTNARTIVAAGGAHLLAMKVAV